jgi:isopentenyl-diphosphate delta-isomerase
MNAADRVVSSEAEELILVDSDDMELGYGSKADCHDGDGVLHRAFSIFLFDDEGELLLQQRSDSKRLWAGYWSNTCCSHPRRGESLEVATRRRLHDELNAVASLEFVYKFRYHAKFGDLGSEHELCHVFLGRLRGAVRPNSEEIADVKYISAGDLTAELEQNGERFTPWLKLEWRTMTQEFAERLANYARS